MENFLSGLTYDEKGLIPVIAQDVATKEILMLAYADREAIRLTVETGRAHYFSRSRNQIWLKGETSENYQYLHSIQVDCDADALIYNVRQHNCACHTEAYSCFYRAFDFKDGLVEVPTSKVKPESSNIGIILDELHALIKHRKSNPLEGSYTNYLFTHGVDKILKKVGEETAEVIIGAKNNAAHELIYETADLLYHLLVLLAEKDIHLHDVYLELHKRKK